MTHHSLMHSLAYSTLEQAIKTALSLDPATKQRVAALNGKTLKLQTRLPDISVLILFNNNGINLFNEEDNDAPQREFAIPYDASIESPGFELLKQVIKSRNSNKLLSENSTELVISGDTKLINECHAIFQSLDIDWEEPLSHFVGDITAHQIGRHARSMTRWAKKSMTTLLQDTQEYLQYESKTMVSDFEYSDFKNAVAEAQQAVEKLEHRIIKLTDHL